MKVTVIERPKFQALVLNTKRSGDDVRKAWREIQGLLQKREVQVSHSKLGYVLVPEWQWATGVRELWVGVEVDSFPPELEVWQAFTLPAQTYAHIRVYGDREQMTKAYAYLNDWFADHAYQRDVRKGSFSLEANRLEPVNPFDLPADEINFFDYDIYAPIDMTQKS